MEVLLAHPTGFVEIYLGEVGEAKVELATRGVLKTEAAKDYRAGHRLYGLVNGVAVGYFKANAVIVTLSTTYVGLGLLRWLSGGSIYFGPKNGTIANIGDIKVGPVPISAIVLIVVVIIAVLVAITVPARSKALGSLVGCLVGRYRLPPST